LSQTYPNADDERCPVKAHLELKKGLADFDEEAAKPKERCVTRVVVAQLRTSELGKIRLLGAFGQTT
jgi:hypothetical protein